MPAWEEITTGAYCYLLQEPGPRLSRQRIQCIRAPKPKREQHSTHWSAGRGLSGGCLPPAARAALALPRLPFPSFIFNRAAAHLRHTDHTPKPPALAVARPVHSGRPWTCFPPPSCNCCIAGPFLPVCLLACLPRLVFVRSYLACNRETDKAILKIPLLPPPSSVVSDLTCLLPLPCPGLAPPWPCLTIHPVLTCL